MSLRYGKPDDGELRLRSRPENFIAPYFVETDKFPASNTKMVGIEAYYRPGPLLVGSEVLLSESQATESGDPMFHGGDTVVSWLLTGETRAYNTRGGFFNQVSPARTVFEGGPGAWELVDASRTSTSTVVPLAAAGSGGDADGQLVSLGSTAARVRLWLWRVERFNVRGATPLLSRPASGPAVKDVQNARSSSRRSLNQPFVAS
jgi:hypothetical protein